MKRFLAMVMAALTLAGCGGDRFPDYRFRMTVEAETPAGTKTAFSVIQDETREVGAFDSSTGKILNTKIIGEAVTVELAQGDLVFALLSKPDNVMFAAGLPSRAIRPVYADDLPDDEQYDSSVRLQKAIAQATGVHDLPRADWPMFVRFRDIADPASVEEVNPDALPGGGRIKRITIEITDDEVTTGIEKRLLWVKTHPGSLVRRKIDQAVGEMPPVHRLNSLAFVQGQQ
jgi:hypothetical protein